MPIISTENAVWPEKYHQTGTFHKTSRTGKLLQDISLDKEYSKNMMKATPIGRRKSDMTRMQILAKTTLTVLGIYAVATLCNQYPGAYMYRREQPAIIPEILSLSAFAVLAALAVYFIIFNNSGFSKRIAGPGEILDPRSRALWLAKSLRVGLVFAGLMLLPRSIPAMVKIPKIFFLIRPALNDIIISKSVPNILKLSYSEWLRNIYGFLRAILALYLIYGAPRFICWQVKHSARQESNIEQKVTAKCPSTNSERSEHE